MTELLDSMLDVFMETLAKGMAFITVMFTFVSVYYLFTGVNLIATVIGKW